MREFQTLKREPVEYIEAHPNEADILHWYYVIEGPPDTPFEGGEYMGELLFPPDYPYKAPGIKMTTPNGRFVTDQELCLSMSNFHPETWSPSWSVGTILLGLLSFMVSEDITTGSLRWTPDSPAIIRKYARESKEWNRRTRTFNREFPDLVE